MGYLDNAGLAYFWGKVKAILPGGSSGGVPVGTIVIWSGTAEDIPEGWALCDGQGGRPDLRDKFVLGAGTSHAVGSTGGSETVTLTTGQMPSHSHTLSLSVVIPEQQYVQDGSNSIYAFSATNSNKNTTSVGGGEAHENMPPYYALYYIIKTAEDSGGGGTSGESNPIGTVISFMGTSAPEGYLVCDGAEYSISQYPALASFFQAQFGTKNHFGGDGESTFAVPDMRNLFLRGYHGEAEEQLSGEMGERQNATEIPFMYKGNSATSGNYIGSAFAPKGSSALGDLYDTKTSAVSIQAQKLTGDSATATDKYPYTFTARPVNMAVLYCIKAVDSASGGSSAGEVYSTEETRIGTWIDGKPLYRRFFQGVTSSLYENVVANDKNIATVINSFGVLNNTNNFTDVTIPSAYTQIFHYYKTGDIAIWVGSENYISKQFAFAIEYTKTTD